MMFAEDCVATDPLVRPAAREARKPLNVTPSEVEGSLLPYRVNGWPKP